jgi:tetrahydromethanopterin S-methyltransferase subunit C
MLPPIVTKSIEHVTSAVISFVIIMVAGAFVAMLLARSFGGNSPIKRQTIFSIVSFGSLCVAAYYAMSRLSGGG